MDPFYTGAPQSLPSGLTRGTEGSPSSDTTWSREPGGAGLSLWHQSEDGAEMETAHGGSRSADWTNGQIERMNRTIKKATVKRYHYDSHNHVKTRLQDCINTYHYGHRLKILKGLTPCDVI